MHRIRECLQTNSAVGHSLAKKIPDSNIRFSSRPLIDAIGELCLVNCSCQGLINERKLNLSILFANFFIICWGKKNLNMLSPIATHLSVVVFLSATGLGS